MGKVASDFEKIINAGRERKKNEALAARIFSKGNRRQSAPSHAGAGAGPSLASRVGVKKRAPPSARAPAGNVNGEWTHDLHNSHSTPNLRAQAKPGSLASRIHAPGTRPPTVPAGQNYRNANTRAAKFANAVNAPDASSQMNIRSAPPTRGITIRGLAGPCAVMAQNFAPGTTAADIESAMTPVGGVAISCCLVKTSPIVIAEIVFETKEGAEAVIDRFNNQTADGLTLKVYLKPGGYVPAVPAPLAQHASDSGRGSQDYVVDGTMGFDDPMETSKPGYGNSGLYSDRMVPSSTHGNFNRRGHGFNRSYNRR